MCLRMFSCPQICPLCPLEACKHRSSICLRGTDAERPAQRSELRVFFGGSGVTVADRREAEGWRPFGPEWVHKPQQPSPSPGNTPLPNPPTLFSSFSLDVLLILKFTQFPGSGPTRREDRLEVLGSSRTGGSLCKHPQARVYLNVNRSRAPL